VKGVKAAPEHTLPRHDRVPTLDCTGAYQAMHQSGGKPAVTGKAPEPQLTFEHVYLTEPEAARLLDGHRIRRGEMLRLPRLSAGGQADCCRQKRERGEQYARGFHKRLGAETGNLHRGRIRITWGRESDSTACPTRKGVFPIFKASSISVFNLSAFSHIASITRSRALMSLRHALIITPRCPPQPAAVVADSFAEAETRAYWRAATPAERLNALEKLREPFYGKDQIGGRLQRFLEVVPAE